MSRPTTRVRLERPSLRRERDYLQAALRSRALHRGYVVAASARTFQCGNVSRARLVNGAVAYNGGGDPNYRTKIEAALALIGDIAPFVDAPQSLAAGGALAEV